MAQGLQTDSNRTVVAGTGHRPQKLKQLDVPNREFDFTYEATPYQGVSVPARRADV